MPLSDLLMFQLLHIFIRIEIGNRKLHELHDDVLERLLAFELVGELVPTSVVIVAHEVKQFYVVVQSPTGLIDQFAILRSLHLL